MLSREQKIDRLFSNGRINAKDVVKTIFGGTDDSAQKAQTRANARAQEFIEEQSAQAREDALRLAPAADVNRNLGFQAALDVLGQTTPQQFGAFQQGNVGAQSALLAGLPQIQNALLGNPLDFSGLQPQTVDVDTSFAQQQLPEFTGIGAALAGPGAVEAEQIGNIGTNVDLFRAASQGLIPGISPEDQEFFTRVLANVTAKGGGDVTGSRFVDDPLGQIPGFLGVPGGMAPSGELSFQNLLTQFAGLQ